MDDDIPLRFLDCSANPIRLYVPYWRVTPDILLSWSIQYQKERMDPLKRELYVPLEITPRTVTLKSALSLEEKTYEGGEAIVVSRCLCPETPESFMARIRHEREKASFLYATYLARICRDFDETKSGIPVEKYSSAESS